MQVDLNHAAEIGLQTMGDDERRKAHAWFDSLRNWENDEFVRSRARKLDVPDSDNVYVLRTGTDLCLFILLHPDHIEIIDIAHSDSLRIVWQASQCRCRL